ncbi:inner integral membrane protein [Enterococcus gallinarum]|nr:inner integral membrane protein [Enterococcus gallinarum]
MYEMKHLKALVVKALFIWAILWITLTGIYDVSFMDSTIVGVIIVVMIYVLGDLVILRKIGNIAATIADAGASALILWLYLTSMNYTTDLWMMVLIPAVLIGLAEWFFHKWLLKENIVPDERTMKE